MTEPSDVGPTEPHTARPPRSRRFTPTLRWRRADLATALFAGLAAVGLAGGHTVAELAGRSSSEHHAGPGRGVDDDGERLPVLPLTAPGAGR